MATQSQKDSLGNLIDSFSRDLEMNPQQKQVLIEEISIKQPNLMSQITGLTSVGVTDDRIKHVLDLLLFLYLYFYDYGKIELPMVTKKIIEEVTVNINAYLEWQNKEDPEDLPRLFEKGVKAYPEIFPFAFMTRFMIVHGFTDHRPEHEHCLMAAKVILDSFVRVQKEIIKTI